jgi:hypothetical protein
MPRRSSSGAISRGDVIPAAAIAAMIGSNRARRPGGIGRQRTSPAET